MVVEGRGERRNVGNVIKPLIAYDKRMQYGGRRKRRRKMKGKAQEGE